MREMIPIIMDKSFNKLCMIDDYISFIWTSRYYSVGDFELCINAEMMSYIQQGFYIMRDDDENIGIIEDIKISETEDGQEMLVVTGRFLACILGRRIIAVQTQLNNVKISDGIYTLITDAIINPSIPARKISNFTLGDYESTERMTQQITGDNLLEAIQSICENNKLGFKVVYDFEHSIFIFKLYEGIDRTYDQSENPYVVFSNLYDNLVSSEYEENYTQYVTDVLIAGEGEGLDRKTVWVSKDNPTGLDRYEHYQDARNASSNNGAISEQEYMNQLRGQGMESITDFTSAFVGEVDFSSVEYRKDVNLGDICVISNTEWGIHIYGRLVEVIESIDNTGAYKILPTFS